jgi:uncharacterized protein
MKRNPFQTELSLLNSTYSLAVQRELKYSPKDPEMGRFALEVFHELQEMILDEGYACTGAQAAFRQETYRLGVYRDLGSEAATAGLAHDLFTFMQERRRIDSDFSTFVAVFTGPPSVDESGFEALLWAQLQSLHQLDAEHHEWDPSVSSDPHDPSFSFSFGGDACFVVGLHPESSRPARRFPYPTLVFNSHEQFERLREQGVYARMQSVIREREQEAHGSINPMLDDFGRSSEARQYSGRAVGPEWRCPFHAQQAEGVG